MDGLAPLTELELAAGIPLTAPPSPDHESRGDRVEPIAAFRATILPALERPPCLVSFSGGRDSSAVLAVAVETARREGLPLPVPATSRFAGADAEESRWQEQVVRHLGAEDWHRLDLGDELDCVGPVAADVMRRHGVLLPSNAHFHEPLLRLARGGSLLTGVGGDELFSTSRWSRATDVLRGRARPVPRDAVRIGFALAPASVKRIVFGRGVTLPMPWLTADAARAVGASLVASAASEPLRWSRRFRWLRSLAYVQRGLASLEVLAADADVLIGHPFFEPAVLDAVAALEPGRRFDSRETGMRMLFTDVLPDELLARRDKASFGSALVGPHSRRFASDWDGSGADEAIVDVEALAAQWQRGEIDGTESLLQHLWLRADAGRSRPA